jgi:chromosome segregation ATPase
MINENDLTTLRDNLRTLIGDYENELTNLRDNIKALTGELEYVEDLIQLVSIVLSDPKYNSSLTRNVLEGASRHMERILDEMEEFYR